MQFRPVDDYLAASHTPTSVVIAGEAVVVADHHHQIGRPAAASIVMVGETVGPARRGTAVSQVEQRSADVMERAVVTGDGIEEITDLLAAPGLLNGPVLGLDANLGVIGKQGQQGAPVPPVHAVGVGVDELAERSQILSRKRRARHPSTAPNP
jgi:hypothetical protein